MDSLTNTIVYTSADIAPQNEGGPEAMMNVFARQLSAEVDSSDMFITSFEVAFIVDTSGNVYGQRIIDDKTKAQERGLQTLKLLSSLKWKPAVCNGRKIVMLYRKKMRIEIEEL